MKYNEYKINAKVWEYPGRASWYFITIPKDISSDITDRFGDRKRGWGSLRVTVLLGDTSWDTSIFPDKKEGTYLLPLKSEMRKKEKVTAGDMISLLLEIRI